MQRKRWYLVGMMALLLACLAACGGGKKEEDGQQAPVVAEVKPAAQVSITLGEDSSSGYQWLYVLSDPGFLHETGNTFQAQGEGTAGARTWTFAADAPGTVELRFEYKQGEQGEAAETIAYTFHVNDTKGISLESSFGSLSEIPQPQMQ